MTTGCAALLAAPVPKGYARGTQRTVAPAETLARVRPLLPALGITRIADVTGLDHIGIPVAMAVRPNARSLAVSQGKGLDRAAAQVSAVMESVESYHAEQITLPLKLARYEDLRYTHRLVDVETLPLLADSLYHPYLRLLWIEGQDLLQDEPVWLPYELVHVDFTLPQPTGSGCFFPSSNGLAAGNHLLEAVSAAICEVVERDAAALWRLLDDAAQQATRLDLATVDDPPCQEVLARYARAGVAVGVWEITSDVGLAAFFCLIADAEEDPLHPVYAAAGQGCHPAREVALLRALTEAAQSRLTAIAGSRDDLARRDYERTAHPDTLRAHRALLGGAAGQRAFAAAPTFVGATFNEDVAYELECLRAVGVERVVLVDLTRADFRLPVARIVIPGLETASSLPGHVPGPRARARAEGRL